MSGRLLRLVPPPVPKARTDVAWLIEQHAAIALDWFQSLAEAYRDPTATEPELTEFCETACDALDARVAALRADLWSGDR